MIQYIILCLTGRNSYYHEKETLDNSHFILLLWYIFNFFYNELYAGLYEIIE